MSVSSWVRRLAPLLVIVAAVALYAWPRSAMPPSSEPAAMGDVESETTVTPTRGSENYRIVDDSTDADVSTGDLSPTDAAARGDEYSPLNRVETNATVTNVVDGDTLDVTFDIGNTARIRMLGVNTPETVDPRRAVECFGKEASAFTKSALEGKLVRLEADPQADERDVYGRLLRNVTLEDGTDFNAKLVSEGYAYAYLSFPLDPARKKQLNDLQTAAKEAKKGLWGEECN